MATKIYVGGLDMDFTEEQLGLIFTKFGEVESSSIATDKKTGKSLGFGYIKMNSENAQKAMTTLHCKVIEGQKLIVNQAQPSRVALR